MRCMHASIYHHIHTRTVAPLRDAVRLVDDEAREETAVLQPAQALGHGLRARELLRGDVQELQPACWCMYVWRGGDWGELSEY